MIGAKTGSGLLKQSFKVPLFTDLKEAGAINFQKIIITDNISNLFSISLQGRDKGSHGDNLGVEKKGTISPIRQLFTTVFHAETQIKTKTMTDVAAIKDKCSTAKLMQAFFNHMGKSGFSGTGQPGKPQTYCLVII